MGIVSSYYLRKHKDIPLKTYTNYKAMCLITNVLDGDTVEFVFRYKGSYEKHRLRILGIDTPEIHTKNEHEKKCGFYAKEQLKALLQKTDNLCYVYLCADDKYGRRLGSLYTYKGNINISTYMITNKLAYSYDGSTKKKWGEWEFNNDCV